MRSSLRTSCSGFLAGLLLLLHCPSSLALDAQAAADCLSKGVVPYPQTKGPKLTTTKAVQHIIHGHLNLEKVECGVAIKDHSIVVLDAKSLMEGPANFASKPYQVKVELAVCLTETKACKEGSEETKIEATVAVEVQDYDECTMKAHSCHTRGGDGTECSNTKGSYACVCEDDDKILNKEINQVADQHEPWGSALRKTTDDAKALLRCIDDPEEVARKKAEADAAAAAKKKAEEEAAAKKKREAEAAAAAAAKKKAEEEAAAKKKREAEAAAAKGKRDAEMAKRKAEEATAEKAAKAAAEKAEREGAAAAIRKAASDDELARARAAAAAARKVFHDAMTAEAAAQGGVATQKANVDKAHVAVARACMCEAAKKAEQEAKVVATKASSELAAKTAAKRKADQASTVAERVVNDLIQKHMTESEKAAHAQSSTTAALRATSAAAKRAYAAKRATACAQGNDDCPSCQYFFFLKVLLHRNAIYDVPYLCLLLQLALLALLVHLVHGHLHRPASTPAKESRVFGLRDGDRTAAEAEDASRSRSRGRSRSPAPGSK